MFIFIATNNLITPNYAEASCIVPNQISNGQLADATALMGNFNALKDCVDNVLTPSGSPTVNSLAVFSASNTLATGNISGDCTTSGGLALTCTKTGGAIFGPFATDTDASKLTGTISTTRFNNGVNADNTHFLRGDGQWAVPPGVGSGGSATGTPSIRASSIQAFSTNSVTVSWPTGTTQGDVVILFIGGGYSINNPTGWTILNNTGGTDWANGLTAAKVINSADLTAGSVTVTLANSWSGVAAAVTIDGSTMTGIREVQAVRSTGRNSFSSTSVTGLFTALNSDLILAFTLAGGQMNASISGFMQVQQLNASYSGFVGQRSSNMGKIGINEIATYPSNNDGYYWSMVALR